MRFPHFTNITAVVLPAALCGGAVAIFSDLTIVGMWVNKISCSDYADAIIVHLPDILIATLLGIATGKRAGKNWLAAGLSCGLGVTLMPGMLAFAIEGTDRLTSWGLGPFITNQCWKFSYVLLVLQFAFLSSRSLANSQDADGVREASGMIGSFARIVATFVRVPIILALSLAAWFVVFDMTHIARVEFGPDNKLLPLPLSFLGAICMAALLFRVWPSSNRRTLYLEAIGSSCNSEEHLLAPSAANLNGCRHRWCLFGFWTLLALLTVGSISRIAWDEARICRAAAGFPDFCYGVTRDTFDLARPITAVENPGKIGSRDEARELARLHEALPNCKVKGFESRVSRVRPLVMGLSAIVCSLGLVLATLWVLSYVDTGISRMPRLVQLMLTPIIYYFLIFGFYLFGGPFGLVEAGPNDPITECARWGTRFAYTMSIVVAIDVLIQYLLGFRRLQDLDTAYYPRMASLRTSLSRVAPRRILIAGLLGVLLYYATTVTRRPPLGSDLALQWSPTLLFWWPLEHYCLPPREQIFLCCALVWGILWLVDCVCRPRRGTIYAAIGFILAACVLIGPAFREGL